MLGEAELSCQETNKALRSSKVEREQIRAELTSMKIVTDWIERQQVLSSQKAEKKEEVPGDEGGPGIDVKAGEGRCRSESSAPPESLAVAGCEAAAAASGNAGLRIRSSRSLKGRHHRRARISLLGPYLTEFIREEHKNAFMRIFVTDIYSNDELEASQMLGQRGEVHCVSIYRKSM